MFLDTKRYKSRLMSDEEMLTSVIRDLTDPSGMAASIIDQESLSPRGPNQSVSDRDLPDYRTFIPASGSQQLTHHHSGDKPSNMGPKCHTAHIWPAHGQYPAK
jgi:hypothetical protein